jgi:uncharacterized membrane protein YGL010W
MKSLQEQIASYAAYHRDPRNTLTHFVGVPLVTFSILVPMGWFRLSYAPDLPLASGAAIFYLAVAVYYLRLDWRVALLQAPFTLALLGLADWASRLPFAESLLAFLAAFVGGWVIQLVGHAFEGRRPALADNFLQIFNAPLFLTAEVLFWLGLRPELRPPSGPAGAPVAVRAGGPELQEAHA